jgi:hypothetical protein
MAFLNRLTTLQVAVVVQALHLQVVEVVHLVKHGMVLAIALSSPLRNQQVVVPFAVGPIKIT